MAEKTQFRGNPRSIEWLYVVMNTWQIDAEMFPYMERAGLSTGVYRAVVAAVSSFAPADAPEEGPTQQVTERDKN